MASSTCILAQNQQISLKSTNSLFQFNCVSISVMKWNPLSKTTCISKGFYIVSDPGDGTAPFSWQMLKISRLNLKKNMLKNPPSFWEIVDTEYSCTYINNSNVLLTAVCPQQDMLYVTTIITVFINRHYTKHHSVRVPTAIH